jgi:cysteine sulfinate desulfinase/cysteine desulfurase-like protein
VLRAIGVRDRDAVIRFSLSRLSTDGEVAQAVDALVAAVADVEPVARARRR